MTDKTPADAVRLLQVLDDYGFPATFKRVRRGPIVSTFEIRPPRGTRQRQIAFASEDIARGLGVESLRVLRIGRNVGIEVPNETRATIPLEAVLGKAGESATLPLTLGLDVFGAPFVADLARMPHLLIAGATGAGKSVCLNAILHGLLSKLSPEAMQLILIDPKRLEFSPYAGIPHLASPIITEPNSAIACLQAVCREMDSRYRRLAALGLRSAHGVTGFPALVVVIDELADLMMTGKDAVEDSIVRLAQLGRAAAIHLIVATQRPSADIITGLIKANLPSRIAFRVASGMDSRVILDAQGAQYLLGRGDMLLSESGLALRRLHGPFVSDAETRALVARLGASASMIPEAESDSRLSFVEIALAGAVALVAAWIVS